MTTIIENYEPIVARSQRGLAEMRGNTVPLAKTYMMATGSGLCILTAVGVEWLTMSVALRSVLEPLSDGTDAGSAMMPIRFGLVGALMFSHLLLHDQGAGQGSIWRQSLAKLHIMPVAAVLAGVGLFMAYSTAQAAGGGNGEGGITGIALGIACSTLFTISFLACNKLVGVFLSEMKALLAERAKRAEIARAEQLVCEAVEYRATLEALHQDIAKDEKPGAATHKAATLAASACAEAAAEAHDAVVSREALEGKEFREGDQFDVSPDTSLEALQARVDYLKGLNVAYFEELLKKDA